MNYYRLSLSPRPQASGLADALVAADASGSPDLHECNVCKQKFPTRGGAFDQKMMKKIRDKKRRRARCHVCKKTGCVIVHDLVCIACMASP